MAKPLLNSNTTTLSLDGLTLGAPQVLGGVRLVPVIRTDAPGDLRLSRRVYVDDITMVQLNDRTTYYSYIPHALVATWDSERGHAVKFGTEIGHPSPKDGKAFDMDFATARVMPKMRAKEAKNRLRFLPLDLAMEGFLAFQFGGPATAWEEYSRSALRRGLSSRFELVHRGYRIAGLEDALRVFEIHEHQVGSLVFVADVLASAFIVPTAADYRDLHGTLITDFFGEPIFYYGLIGRENTIQPDGIVEDAVNHLVDLRRELARMRHDWSEMHQALSRNLFGVKVTTKKSYSMGPFQLQTFMTDLDPKSDNHIGELITRRDGKRNGHPVGPIEYLKTYRLSAAQCRRAYLLKQLAESDWELEACAAKFGCTKNQLIYRIEKAGFGYLLHQHVIDAARAQRRQTGF